MPAAARQGRRPDAGGQPAAPAPTAVTDSGGDTGERYVTLVDLDELRAKFALRNPKAHNAAGLRTSINEFGFVDLPVIDERTGRVVGGHGRIEDLLGLRAADKPPPERGGVVVRDGRWLVPTQRGWASKGDDEAHAAGVALNHQGEGLWDRPDLSSLLADLAGREPTLFAATGFTPEDLADMLQSLGPAPPIDDIIRGEPQGGGGDGDFWPILRVQMPPETLARWLRLSEQMGPDEPDHVRFDRLLDAAEAANDLPG